MYGTVLLMNFQVVNFYKIFIFSFNLYSKHSTTIVAQFTTFANVYNFYYHIVTEILFKYLQCGFSSKYV